MSLLSPLSAAVASVAILTTSIVVPSASANERAYFRDIAGTWSGAGQIVAGPYKNTRFTCNLTGTTPQRAGMKLSGTCRVGLFSQPIEATVVKRGRTYKGKFLDGAKGKGLDIVSGRLRSKKLVLGIKRKQLRGSMVANLKSRNKLNISILVNVDNKQVPFIGLTLGRTGSASKTVLAN